MLKVERTYPSDLSNQQWKAIRELLPCARSGGRPRTTDIREVLDAIFYLNKTGCAWRYLPMEFPPWQTVYTYYRRWKVEGVWQKIHDHLRGRVRKQEGKNRAASTLIIDSQTIKATSGINRGYDGYKKIRGRKRHIFVDTLGLLHSVSVHTASFNDTITGYLLFKKTLLRKRLKRIYADHGYRGTFVAHARGYFGFEPTIPNLGMNRRPGVRNTTKEKMANRVLKQMAPKRWIVERTFAWFNHFRRLSKDYEKKTPSSECMLYLAMTQIMLKRLTCRGP